MSAVTQVQSTARVTDPAAIPEASTPGEASLLPPPSPGALGTNAGLSMLYYLESKDGQDGIQSGTKKVQGLETERKQALDKELQAIQQQDEAAPRAGPDQVVDVLDQLAPAGRRAAGRWRRQDLRGVPQRRAHLQLGARTLGSPSRKRRSATSLYEHWSSACRLNNRNCALAITRWRDYCCACRLINRNIRQNCRISLNIKMLQRVG